MTLPAPSTPPPARDATLQLPDGRALGYSRTGAEPSGAGAVATLLYLHGNPGSRTEVLRPGYRAAFEAARLHLISVDRPGYGDSDPPPAPGLGHAPFADDLTHLLDHLNLSRVPVLGASRGALPALALAARHPGRVSAVGLFGPTGLPDDPHLLADLDPAARGLLHLVKHRPAAARAVMRAGAWLDRTFPAGAVGRLMQVLPSTADRTLLDDGSSGEEWVSALATGMRGNPGFAVDDWRSWLVDPLGFAPADVRAPVVVWTGALDRTCPPGQSAYLARHLPDARRAVLPGVGHLHTPARLVALAEAVREAARAPGATG